ncbi:MAG: clostripain-related cysteine peptidase [Prevotella bivia]|nr:clostripain-related cysteine peptidase [Prevotella bivia]
MRKILFHFTLLLTVVMILAGCSKDDPIIYTGNDAETSSVIIMYLPWTGNASGSNEGLYSALADNAIALEQGIKQIGGIPQGQKVMVFISESPTSSELYQLVTKDGVVEKIPVNNQYSTYDFGTPAGLSSLLKEIKHYTHATNSTKFGLIMGGHGSGWTQKEIWEEYPTRSTTDKAKRDTQSSWAPPQFTMTRFMGSVADKQYALDLNEIASAIMRAGVKLEYLILDDCYMANVETAYTFRNATHYLVASTSEILKEGMPYKIMYPALNPEAPSFVGMTKAFATYYNNKRTYALGALSAIDCSKIEALAEEMKVLNGKYKVSAEEASNIQILGGFNPTIFFDMLSYVKHMNPTVAELSSFKAKLQEAVITSTCTPTVYSAIYGIGNFIPIAENCGLTISDPTTHPTALKGLQHTEWWGATH